VRSSAYAFGRRLRDERERQGVTLAAIASTTKINLSFLAGLERGDVSAWPSGIFRRAFVRGYATAIGVSPEPIVAEFSRLFPDEGTPVEGVVPEPAPAGEPRLALALDARTVGIEALTRMTIALLEACLIVSASIAATAWAPAVDPWRICAAAALLYYPLSKIVPARGRLLSYIRSEFQSLGNLPQQVAAADVREAFHLVTRPSSEMSIESSEDFAGAASPLRSASR